MGFATRFTRKLPTSPSNVESSATPCAWPAVGLSKEDCQRVLLKSSSLRFGNWGSGVRF